MLFRGCTGHFQTHPNFQFHAPDVGGTHPFLRARWGQRPDHGTLGQPPVGSPSAKKKQISAICAMVKTSQKACCMVFDSSIPWESKSKHPRGFLSMTIPFGGVDHPNTRSFRWWVSSKQGVSQFSCFQLKDCIILAVFDGKPRFVERWAWLDFVRCHCFPGSEVMKNLGLRCGVFKCEWFFVYMWGWKWCSKNKTYVQ